MVCAACAHLRVTREQLLSGESARCLAFEKIPPEIMSGKMDHSKAFPEDKGYRFKVNDAWSDSANCMDYYYEMRNSEFAKVMYGDGPDFADQLISDEQP